MAKWKIIIVITIVLLIGVVIYFNNNNPSLLFNNLSENKINSFNSNAITIRGITKDYNATSKEVKITDNKGSILFDIILESPSVNTVPAGKDQLIAQIRIKNYSGLYDLPFSNINLSNLKDNNKTIIRNIKYRYGEYYYTNSCYGNGYDSFGNDLLVCGNGSFINWTDFSSLRNIPNNNEIIIGLFMDTYNGENIEWVPIIKVNSNVEFNISEWASVVVPANTWVDIRDTDLNNFTKANGTVNSVFVNLTNLSYFIGNGGVFGVYNSSDNISLHLMNLDLDNWIGTTQMRGMTYDWKNDLIYIGLATGGLFGVYNITNNTIYNLGQTDEGNFMGTTGIYSLDYDSVNDLVYISFNTGLFGVYNRTSNITSNLSNTDTGNWVGTSAVLSVSINTSNPDIVYTGVGAGKFGYYNRTSNVWVNLSTNDTIPFNNWSGAFDVSGVEYNPLNGNVYTVGGNGLLGVFNGTSWNNLNATDTGNWALTTYVFDIEYNPYDLLLYTGHGAGLFGAYNYSDNVWYNLSNTDPSNWSGRSASVRLGQIGSDGLVHTGQPAGLRGIYSLNAYPPSSSTCTYSSGNWAINCADNCSITSNVNLNKNNISIVGTGTFKVSGANITNFTKIYIAGTDSSNKCTVTCISNGCFR